MAERIIAHRNYKTVEEIDKVPGIGKKTLEKLAPLVRVTAPRFIRARALREDAVPDAGRARSSPPNRRPSWPFEIYIRLISRNDDIRRKIGYSSVSYTMSNKQFWTKTNAAAKRAAASARKQKDAALRKDWKLKQASRGGSHSYVSISEVRTLGTGRSRAISRG